MPAACHPTWWGAGQVQVKLWGGKGGVRRRLGWAAPRSGPGGAAVRPRDLVEPLALHDEVAGLLDAGKVERADRAMALAHRCAQPRPDARRQRQGSKVGPAWLAGKISAGNRRILQECVHRRALAESHLRPARERRGLPAAAAQRSCWSGLGSSRPTRRCCRSRSRRPGRSAPTRPPGRARPGPGTQARLASRRSRQGRGPRAAPRFATGPWRPAPAGPPKLLS
jgi:hypothetical protein